MLQLCNECHTWDYYEISRGQTPGTLLYNWEVWSCQTQICASQFATKINIFEICTHYICLIIFISRRMSPRSYEGDLTLQLGTLVRMISYLFRLIS